VDKHAFGSAGTSRNEIETIDESVSRVGEASGTVQLVSYKMRQLSAIANWGRNLCGKSATILISVSNCSNLCPSVFLQQPMIRLHMHEVKLSCCMCNKSQVHESHINWLIVNVHVYGTLSISGASFCECEFSTLCALWKVNHTSEL